MKQRVCKGCAATHLALPHPGPRCHRCHQIERKRVRLASKVRNVAGRYGLTAQQYDALYEAQGGVCALCRRATGAGTHRGARRLAVDHDHSCPEDHPSNQGCTQCVRGLVCGPCNDALATFRDDPETFFRGGLYLISPPWHALRECASVDKYVQEGA